MSAKVPETCATCKHAHKTVGILHPLCPWPATEAPEVVPAEGGRKEVSEPLKRYWCHETLMSENQGLPALMRTAYYLAADVDAILAEARWLLDNFPNGMTAPNYETWWKRRNTLLARLKEMET